MDEYFAKKLDATRHFLVSKMSQQQIGSNEEESQ